MRRRSFLALPLVALLLLLAGGVALAKHITCDGGRCEGTPRNDLILGASNRRDAVLAGDGDDKVDGRGGDDELRGGSGNDVLFGTVGKLTLLGEEGNDHLVGEIGADTLDGGAGVDLLIGGLGNDVLRGGDGDERLGGLRLLAGGDGNDRIAGGFGDDGLRGDGGSDRLSGGDGNDLIDGVDGETVGTRDIIDCGRGFDVVDANQTDAVAADCEDVNRFDEPTLTAATRTADDEEHERLRAAFRAFLRSEEARS